MSDPLSQSIARHRRHTYAPVDPYSSLNCMHCGLLKTAVVHQGVAAPKLREILWTAIHNGTKSGSDERMRLLSALSTMSVTHESIEVTEGELPSITTIDEPPIEAPLPPRPTPVVEKPHAVDQFWMDVATRLDELEKKLSRLATTL